MDLLIVGDRRDALVAATAAEATRCGAIAVSLPPAEAATALTIRSDGRAAVVEPAVPMFLRSLHVAPSPETDLLVRGEVLSHLWAAGALMPRPVVNRPGLFGLSGLFSDSLPVCEQRIGRARQAEVYSSEPPQEAAPGFCIQDLGTFATAVLPQLPRGQGPYRLREMPGEVQKRVVVSGASAHSIGGAAAASDLLEQESLDAARRLEFDLALLTWSVGDDREPVLARIDPFPSARGLEMLAAAIARDLCAVLLS